SRRGNDLLLPVALHGCERKGQSRRIGSSRGESAVTQGARILVVDDERQIRRSLQVNLETKGYAVETAENGAEAIAAFQNRRPDIVILDLVMPGIEGVEVVRRLRTSSSVPIIVLSAMGEERHKVEALETGADDYITKPFGMEELLARIKSLLRRAAGARS